MGRQGDRETGAGVQGEPGSRKTPVTASVLPSTNGFWLRVPSGQCCVLHAAAVVCRASAAHLQASFGLLLGSARHRVHWLKTR